VPVAPLVYKGADHAPQPVVEAPSTQTAAAGSEAAAKKKAGFFTRVGRFFKRIFGAE
jgi:hypothetical protein